MSLPICPKCRSSNVSFGGERIPNGSDRCNACGYTAPVREFHPDPDTNPAFIAIPPHIKRGLKTIAHDIQSLPLTVRTSRQLPEPHEIKMRKWWLDD